MKKICFVLENLAVGGVELSLINLLREFDYSKYEITLLLRYIEGEFYSQIDNRVKIRQWQIGPWWSTWFNRIKCHIHSDFDMNSVYSARCIVTSKEKFDCVIGFKALDPFVMVIASEIVDAKKRILWVHGRTVLNERNRKVYEKIIGRFDRVFCVSIDSNKGFNKLYPFMSERTAIIYNIFNKAEIIDNSLAFIPREFSKTSQNICTVGRLVGVKGQVMVPEITRFLLDAGYDIKWYLVGDGPNKAEVEASIAKYNVADHVILLGTKLNPYPYIRNCDIYVQPSFSEGYCTTTMEAKILHKPIVTTDAPGMREQFVSGENGLIVDEMTPESLYKGIKYLLDHPEVQQKFIESLSRETCDNSGELQKLYDFIEN